MKFWEKIFLCILITFEVFFVPSCVYLFNSNFNLNYNEEINSAIKEQQRICSSLESNMYLLKVQQGGYNNTSYRMDVDKRKIDSMIKRYLDRFGDQDILFEIMDDKDEVIFNNCNIDNSEFYKSIDTSTDKVNYIIQDNDNKKYLIIAKQVNLEGNIYRVSYIRDISKIYTNREYLFDLLLKLNIFVSMVLVVVTIILSRAIVNPINKLIQSTKTIAEGNFSERVKVSSSDEVGTLSEQFNSMADVIEGTITELERAAEDKQRFIDNLAHELRTPLTSIIGYSDFLRTNKCTEEVLIESLSCIYDAGVRLEKLSFTLMDLIMLRKEEFEMKDEDLKDVLLEVKNNVVYKLKNKKINLKVTSDSLKVKMNRSLMIILISNLVDNAIKASKDGSSIYLRGYAQNNGQVVIEVEDKGAGIPKEDIENIFEPFYMVDKSRERANGGVGLGLSLCQNIANVHNAKIAVDSDVGIGTTVKIIKNVKLG